METTRLQENISAMVDNELPPCDVELTLAALTEPEGQAAWHVYHLIRDALQETPVAQLSPGFTARLAERLAQEELPGRPADAVNTRPAGEAPAPATAILPSA